jgi:hypothetical protein
MHNPILLANRFMVRESQLLVHVVIFMIAAFAKHMTVQYDGLCTGLSPLFLPVLV